MATSTINVFYLGVLGDFDLDPGEVGADSTSTVSENADILLTAGPGGDGVFGSTTDPFYNSVEEITLDSGSSDLVVADSEIATETLPSESITFEGVTSALDSTQQYEITVTYKDGTTATGIAAVIQDDQGRTFMVPFFDGSSENDILTAAPIVSVEFTAIDNDNFLGVPVNLEQVDYPCFASGTMIRTDRGEVAVEDLAPGDLIATRDNGLQPIRWIGARTVPAMGAMAPVVIGAGVLGTERDLTISPQHRMFVDGWMAEAMFGEAEVLVTARHLLGHDQIRRAPRDSVTYHHILLGRHEVIWANGALTESFHPGDVSLDAMGAETRDEIFALFPELRQDVAAYGATARRCAKAHEARLLTRRI